MQLVTSRSPRLLSVMAVLARRAGGAPPKADTVGADRFIGFVSVSGGLHA
ncbi:MAG TPA: hypothetical protein VL242_43855 [Sorangium sp.]|nr:hypothetical protein [Sorangium sp.]